MPHADAADWPTALVDFPGDGPPDPQGRSPARRRWRFAQPKRWLVAHDAAQVPKLLDDAHALALAGQWCVGWLAYEAAPGLDPCLPVKALPPGAPYAVWAVFDVAEPWPEGQPAHPGVPGAAWQLGRWQTPWGEAQLHQRIDAVRDLIRAGEVYQINLTGAFQAPFGGGSPGNLDQAAPEPQEGCTAALLAYFDALQRSQGSGYACYLDARAACRTPGVLLSASPELFFDWQAPHITTRPMKGTATRHASASEDAAAAAALHASPKERAENLMIVDLLRNDLSRVAEVGSVSVPALFAVHALPTVWQMTSTITARTRPGLRLSELMAALFPCGSVTGAPKRQAMHHIARLEHGPRGVYCGAAGLMAPGGRVTLNVPIRTVCMDTPPPPAPWRARCGIGSGITLDATPTGEAREWQHKRSFLHRAHQPFELLESMRLQGGRLQRLDLHLDRLARSAQHFGFAWNPQVLAHVQQVLRACAWAHPTGLFKLRLRLDAWGRAQVSAEPLVASVLAPAVSLATTPMPAADDFVRHKTTHRAVYQVFPPAPGCFDTLLYNEDGELTEFTIGNVALCLGGQWATPPAACGLLPGVMREHLLRVGRLIERRLTLDDLPHAEGLALLNSVRGWLDVTLVSPSP